MEGRGQSDENGGVERKPQEWGRTIDGMEKIPAPKPPREGEVNDAGVRLSDKRKR